MDNKNKHITSGMLKSQVQGHLGDKPLYFDDPSIFGSSVWHFLHVTLVASKILRWLIDFVKFVGHSYALKPTSFPASTFHVLHE
jgi:hypothetical protein